MYNNMKPASLNANIVYLCSTFTHFFNRTLLAEFRQHKLSITPEQFALLVLLWYKDGLTQKEISEQLNRDKTTVTRVIMNMKKRKMVKQETDMTDSRSRRIYITARGKTLQTQGLKISGELYMRVLKNISTEKLNGGVELVRNLIKNL